MQPMHVPAGATIFRTGDPSSAVYVIEDGEIAITVNGGIEVARLHSGELFGESGVLEARVRAATATTTTATTLLATDAEIFFHAFGMNNDRALTLVKLLCARLRSTTARAARPGFAGGHESDASAAGPVVIRLLPDSERLTGEYGMAPIDVHHLPFQVGNRYGVRRCPSRPTTAAASRHGEPPTWPLRISRYCAGTGWWACATWERPPEPA
jgi:CRP/FNR family cyclic AMP-dependent transcriptional regulator